MCNRYNIKGTTKEIAEFFEAHLPSLFDLPSEDILPGHLASGLILNRDRERELVPMQFGLAKIGASKPFDQTLFAHAAIEPVQIRYDTTDLGSQCDALGFGEIVGFHRGTCTRR